MCGIVGFTGMPGAAPILLDGLKKLEYRGYDSAGIAVMNKQNIATLTREYKDGSTLAIIVNLTYDTTGDIVIRYAKPVKKIERLMPNGKWVPQKFKKKGKEYSFPCEITCYANAVIRVTPEK